MTTRVTRPRRSCLSVPGSSPKMLSKAQGLPADEVFMDLEDSVAPGAKEEARQNIVQALKEGDWTGKTVVVRVNGVYTKWCARDVIEVDEIAAASDRAETLIFGPADMSASLGLPTVTAGLPMPSYPGDHWHYVLERILIAARHQGLQVIDGPYLVIKDLDGFREMSLRSRALGYDGKWALHPGQIDVLNEVFTPTQDEFDKAEAMLEAYEHATDVQLTGAVMFGNEMIDEASRKMAEQLALRGRAAGLQRVRSVEDFTEPTVKG